MGKWLPNSKQVKRVQFARWASLVGVCICGRWAAALRRKPLREPSHWVAPPLNEAVVMFVPLERGRSKTGARIEDGKYGCPRRRDYSPGNIASKSWITDPFTQIPMLRSAASYLRSTATTLRFGLMFRREADREHCWRPVMN